MSNKSKSQITINRLSVLGVICPSCPVKPFLFFIVDGKCHKCGAEGLSNNASRSRVQNMASLSQRGGVASALQLSEG